MKAGLLNLPQSKLFDNDSWTPQPLSEDELSNPEDDIFQMSGSSNESNSRQDQDFDEESLYSDALSRKASVVSKIIENLLQN